jgi:diphthamide synthase subunit DPH2
MNQKPSMMTSQEHKKLIADYDTKIDDDKWFNAAVKLCNDAALKQMSSTINLNISYAYVDRLHRLIEYLESRNWVVTIKTPKNNVMEYEFTLEHPDQ